MTPLSEFLETWYIHSMGGVNKPQQISALSAIWLRGYKGPKLWIFVNFLSTSCYKIAHIFGWLQFYVNLIAPSYSMLSALSNDVEKVGI